MASVRLQARRVWHFGKSLLLGALPAKLYFGDPGSQLTIIGITGTDGKTTSSTLLYRVLQQAGYKVALISTVAAYIGDTEIDTGFHTTSPEPWLVYKLLKRCVDEGITHVVLEVTSHGSFQFRVWGIPFALAGITNVTHEHLDYFEDWETYATTKANFLASAEKAVANEDDTSFSLISRVMKAKKKPLLSYSATLKKSKVDDAIRARFPENYNWANSHLVYTLAQELGVADDDFIQAIADFVGVPGRMERIPNKRGLDIVVDFAHTPNALREALTALRAKPSGNLIAVFGSAGLRDRTKRPLMGAAGSEIADMVVFTAEDPRVEDVNVIIRQMKEGVKAPNHRKIVSIPDRYNAIEWALQHAKRGDTIGIFGKGHEKSMCYGHTEFPWSDQDAVREILAKNA